MLRAKFPEKTEFLFKPWRYKVLRGGRGSAKSHSAAGALAVIASEKRHRILCTREVQTSIKDSVHKLICDKIIALGLRDRFDIYQHEIRGVNGSEFIFGGLADQTSTSIKSMEGCTIVWCEEAHVISKRSWDILIPTIRADDSEIWITYNPDLESDETHQRFTINPPPRTMNVEMNWRDNPWFPKVLEEERVYCKINDPDNYGHIWEGECRPAVEGAIFFKQVQEVETNRRICNVPHDPMLRVHVVLDLGWEDALAVCLVQKHVSEIRIIEYLEYTQTAPNVVSSDLRSRPYQWGRLWPPHDGYSKSLNSEGKSTADIFKKLGWDVPDRSEITTESKEEGIRQTRLAFPRMYFDREKCAAQKAPVSFGNVKFTKLSNRLIECLKRYRRTINRQTGAAGATVRDPHAHGADCLRYVALNADSMSNEGAKSIVIPGIRKGRIMSRESDSWMAM